MIGPHNRVASSTQIAKVYLLSVALFDASAWLLKGHSIRGAVSSHITPTFIVVLALETVRLASP